MPVITLLLRLEDAVAMKSVSMPIMPPGTMVRCNQAHVIAIPIANWDVKPDKPFGTNTSVTCNLEKQPWRIDGALYGTGETTFRKWLESEGWAVNG